MDIQDGDARLIFTKVKTGGLFNTYHLQKLCFPTRFTWSWKNKLNTYTAIGRF